jgi:glycyl-tRNA synthetase beta chain
MGKELFIEIGTEEIPAEFLNKTLRDMEELIRKELTGGRIPFGEIRTLATPRRLVVLVSKVAEKQEEQVIEKLGPAKRVSFDEQGNPTKAALGFARGQGLEIGELETIVTDKGEYICARRKIAGEETASLLPAMIPRFILSIPFQKSMRWSNLEVRFARPIHWIIALFGADVVPFRLENLASGNKSFGHRFMSPKPFAVKSFRDYLSKSAKKYIVVDQDERRKMIVAEVEKAAQSVNGTPLIEEDLLDEVNYLVEYPSAVCGSFDASYLELPKDVLTTTMMSHQKYFPVLDGGGRLMPYFITINNTVARDPSVVARGNEKVIRARLADAKFFFREDSKVPLDRHFEKLHKVVFHSQLGTSYEKVMHFRQLAGFLAAKIDSSLAAKVDRAALLSKADLETQMVYEFPELQGIMGREYSLIQGEDPVVARAVYEHYLPTSAGGELPETGVGAILSIADKVDTITGFFGIGQIPTGTADPYALRRQALGVINIILDKGWPVDLPGLLDQSISILADRFKRPADEIKKDVIEFFRARFENQLISQGHPYDVVDAVLSTGLVDFGRSLRKIKAMETFKSHIDFEPLAVAFKRVVNILKSFAGGPVNPAVFTTPEEGALYEAYNEIRDKAAALIDKEDYEAALVELARLRKPVDAFFESVLVMDPDEKVRTNRLSMLSEISRLFYRIADFSKIVTEK